MRCLLAGLVLLLAGCIEVPSEVTVRHEVPWCPVSDSAWTAADSVPAICLVFADTTAVP